MYINLDEVLPSNSQINSLISPNTTKITTLQQTPHIYLTSNNDPKVTTQPPIKMKFFATIVFALASVAAAAPGVQPVLFGLDPARALQRGGIQGVILEGPATAERSQDICERKY